MNNIKRLLCQWESPEQVAYKLIQEWGEAGFIWLDGDGSDLGRWVTLGTVSYTHLTLPTSDLV